MTRVRMITFYLDTRIPAHPRLVRRVNNGDPTTFDNTLGTAVAVDVENLQIQLRPGGLATRTRRTCASSPRTWWRAAPCARACSVNQIRKMNITLTGRSRQPSTASREFFRNSVSPQVSLRGMAFVDEYFQ